MKALVNMYWWLFSYFHPALRILRRSHGSLLDVGCGRGFPVKYSKIHYKVGMDINISSLRSCLKEKTHYSVVLCDARRLPFHDKSFDAVLCLQVLHFLQKNDSLKVLGELERIARKKVVLGIPIGFIPEGIKDSWKSIWNPSELVSRGYQVKTFGFRLLHQLALRKAGTFCSKIIFSTDPFINVIEGLIQNRGYYMICYKHFSA